MREMQQARPADDAQTPAPAGGPDTVVFDLGGVLIDWDPRYVLSGDGTTSADDLLVALDIDGAQRELDLGKPFADVHARWLDTYADHAEHVDRYFGNWHGTIAGAFDDVVDILRELRDRPVRLYALSNFSGELYRQIRSQFDFLTWFDGLLISGDEGVIKPDPRIYRLLLDRYRLTAGRTVFIDDRPENVDAARTAGLIGINFVGAAQLRAELAGLGLLDGDDPARRRGASAEQ